MWAWLCGVRCVICGVVCVDVCVCVCVRARGRARAFVHLPRYSLMLHNHLVACVVAASLREGNISNASSKISTWPFTDLYSSW